MIYYWHPLEVSTESSLEACYILVSEKTWRIPTDSQDPFSVYQTIVFDVCVEIFGLELDGVKRTGLFGSMSRVFDGPSKSQRTKHVVPGYTSWAET